MPCTRISFVAVTRKALGCLRKNLLVLQRREPQTYLFTMPLAVQEDRVRARTVHLYDLEHRKCYVVSSHKALYLLVGIKLLPAELPRRESKDLKKAHQDRQKHIGSLSWVPQNPASHALTTVLEPADPAREHLGRGDRFQRARCSDCRAVRANLVSPPVI